MKEKQKLEMRNIFMPEDLISSYSREQAIDDGVLVDVSQVAREAGIKFPVALSHRVFDDCVSWPEEDAEKSQWPQDEAGRLWDVLWLLRQAMLSAKTGDSTVTYKINRVPRAGRGKQRMVSLRAAVNGGDDGEPVVTVMFPDED